MAKNIWPYFSFNDKLLVTVHVSIQTNLVLTSVRFWNNMVSIWLGSKILDRFDVKPKNLRPIWYWHQYSTDTDYDKKTETFLDRFVQVSIWQFGSVWITIMCPKFVLDRTKPNMPSSNAMQLIAAKALHWSCNLNTTLKTNYETGYYFWIWIAAADI